MAAITEILDPVSGNYVKTVDGVETVRRSMTADEQASLAAQQANAAAAVNAALIRQRAATALTANATFLALASPTQAQAVAQVQRLTREVNGLLRVLLGSLSDVSDV